MARPSKKSVYERIEDKKKEIQQAEEILARLNQELQVLYKEQDQEEMTRMLDAIRSQGIDIETALTKLSGASTKKQSEK